ncbi:hypothetical protein JCM14467A_02150 [Vulcanisaeta sp. JCM 14467]
MAGEGYVVGVGIRDVFDEVLRARVAYVVSPWIQEPYASKLLKMVMEGRAMVVTSRGEDNAFYNFLDKLRNTAGIKYGLLLLIIGMTGLLTILFNGIFISGSTILYLIFLLAFIAPGLALILWARMSAKELLRKNPWLANIRLSPPLGEDGFIHIKLYIADGRAWVGSANMTVSAWKHNIEVLVPIDLETARRIFEEAWSMARPLT